MLKSIRKDDRLYFTDFTLLIFDECHHCDGDHPYNGFIMHHSFSLFRIYKSLKFFVFSVVLTIDFVYDVKILVLMRMLHGFDGPKPQIVGLTASLPVGSGRFNVEAAVDVSGICFKFFLLIFKLKF